MRTWKLLTTAALLAVGALLGWLAASGRLAPDVQAQDKKPVADKPKFATDIPAAVTVPDRIETRLGTLRFSDGFPDDATVTKVYDNINFQRGVQAFLTAMPAASLSAMRKGIRSRACQAYLWGLPIVGLAEWKHANDHVFKVRRG
jgi:hypothetical protein